MQHASDSEDDWGTTWSKERRRLCHAKSGSTTAASCKRSMDSASTRKLGRRSQAYRAGASSSVAAPASTSFKSAAKIVSIAAASCKRTLDSVSASQRGLRSKVSHVGAWSDAAASSAKASTSLKSAPPPHAEHAYDSEDDWGKHLQKHQRCVDRGLVENKTASQCPWTLVIT